MFLLMQNNLSGLKNWKKLAPINKPAPVIHQLKIDSKTSRYLSDCLHFGSQKQNETNNVFSTTWSGFFAYGNVGNLEECENSGFLDKFLFYFESLYWKG